MRNNEVNNINNRITEDMKQKNKNSGVKKVLKIILLVILVLNISAVIFAVINIKKTSIMRNHKGITLIKEADYTPVDNPRIFIGDKIIYSETGALYEGLKGDSYMYVSLNYDSTMAAITMDEKLYFIDGYLDPVLLCSDSSSRGIISKRAPYVLYNDMDDTKCLCVYDAKNHEKIQLATGYARVYDSAISSNGKYVTYYDRENGMLIKNIDNPEEYTRISGKRFDALAISSDGKRAFYSLYDDSTYFVFYYNDGNLNEISRGKHSDFVINDDCTEIIIEDMYATRFYGSTMDYSVEIMDSSFFGFLFCKEAVGVDSKHSGVRMVDYPTLKGCVLDTVKGDFYFYDPDIPANDLGNHRYYDPIYFDDGKVYYLYMDSDNYLVRIVNDGRECYEERIPEIETTIRTYTANIDLSEIYYIDRKDRLWIDENGETRMLYENAGLDYYIFYDKYSGRVFFIDDDCLCSISKNGDDYRVEFDGANYISTNYYDYEDFVVFSSDVDHRYMRIFGNYMERN
ncbi:hypothetical protein [Butyrivibrio sp. VCB2006]|uniref:hypothetical protein n=1 Tax=Butyrivibrio sp. VCB2006 TaxID=1280679 RepID=UPI0003F8BDD0|nr:hypothetical protein [Butyrivibrio sp. VCB2006]